MAKPQIGILAGMGPRSTAPFVDAVVSKCQELYGAKLDEEFPEMNILSLPTPFYVDRAIDHDAMKERIVGGLRKLEASGSSFVSMPCNSAHAYFKELSQSIKIPLLNIVEETLGQLREGQRTTVLATRGTMASRLYQIGITKAGLEYEFNPDWQDLVDTVVSAVKAGDIQGSASGTWDQLITHLQALGVNQAVIACTDINAVLPYCKTDIAFVDSTECLAQATVRQYLKLRE
ncbi:aspartate/glutamate racemase family protein [Celerinatantimonas yamalensis]|uniref:Amino acid racemase n=1 Tax=Celerinatantimonas yamalensis TaxID=559956 RepID=A0ABW9G289_9GAMM